MSKILSIYGLHASSLELRDNHAWELGLDNGVQLRLGKRDLEKRISRFCKAYPAVFAENRRNWQVWIYAIRVVWQCNGKMKREDNG